jgi:hypothetical protein
LPRLRREFEKRVSAVAAPGATEPTPLGRVFVLAPGAAAAVEPLAAGEAVVELLRHSYGACTLQQVRRAAHFLQCARIARDVPVARLGAPRSFAALPEVVRRVEAAGHGPRD